MDFADSEARRIFFAYALPCLEIHVTKGELTKQEARKIIHSYRNGEEMPAGLENMFFKAKERCEGAAEETGKKAIDAEAVRDYFLYDHNNFVVLESIGRGGKGLSDYCKTLPGIVLRLKDAGHAVVLVKNKEREYRTDFIDDLREGDSVVGHRAFLSEKINEKLASMIPMV